MQTKINQIIRAIEKYAEAYRELDELQREKNGLLQIGDQKTGVIGEFYALLYAKKIYGNQNAELADNPSQPGHDIVVRDKGCNKEIQVKTVSAFSEKGIATPCKGDCHEIYCISLDKNLNPNGFWIISDTQEIIKLRGKKIRIPKKRDQIGSKLIKIGTDKFEELKKLLK